MGRVLRYLSSAAGALLLVAVMPIWAQATTVKIITDADCETEACTSGSPAQYCRESATGPMFPCDSTAGFYRLPFGFSSANCSVEACDNAGTLGQQCIDGSGLWLCDGAGSFALISVNVPGSDTQVIFNDGGALGADSGLVYFKAIDLLSTGSFIASTGDIIATSGDLVVAGGSSIQLEGSAGDTSVIRDPDLDQVQVLVDGAIATRTDLQGFRPTSCPPNLFSVPLFALCGDSSSGRLYVGGLGYIVTEATP